MLLIVNDPPYGSERPYNALRLANAVMSTETDVTIFLMADAVLAAKKGQKTPDGYYNVERMLKRFVSKCGKVLLCGTCLDARGLTEEDLLDGPRRSTMDELAAITVSSDKVLVF